TLAQTGAIFRLSAPSEFILSLVRNKVYATSRRSIAQRAPIFGDGRGVFRRLLSLIYGESSLERTYRKRQPLAGARRHRYRRADRADRQFEEKWQELQRTLSVPPGKDAFIYGQPRQAVFSLLWMQGRRYRDRLRDEARSGRIPGG